MKGTRRYAPGKTVYEVLTELRAVTGNIEVFVIIDLVQSYVIDLSR